MASPDFGEVLHRLMHRYKDALRDALQAAEVSLAVPQIRILKGIGAQELATASDVGDCLGYDKGQFARVLKSLEGLGHVQREPHPSDGRRQILGLTATGRTLLATVRAAEASAAKRLAGPLSAAELEHFTRLALLIDAGAARSER